MAGKGRVENLRLPWKKGESGNLSGRPKRRPIHDAIAKLLSGPEAEALVLAHIKAAQRKNPNTSAAQFLRDSYEGKPAQSVDVTGTLTLGWAERLERARQRRLKKLEF